MCEEAVVPVQSVGLTESQSCLGKQSIEVRTRE